MNLIHRHLRFSVRGASHAPCLRFVLEGLPAGLMIDRAALAAFMERRAPGRDALSTARRESDAIEWRGGLDAAGRTTGEPLAGVIANRDARPADYGADLTVPRPGHADFPQWVEAGRIPTGGGANSGRLTAALCAAGGVCLQWLERRGVAIHARVEAIHGNADDPAAEVAAAKAAGDSVGGTIACEATGLPAGVGGALFDGIETALSGALFAIPGVKGVEFGNGFAAATLRGSENNDAFVVGDDGTVRTATNRHGGLLGGRTTGMPVTFRVALKPTPTIFLPQPSVDLATMRPATCVSKGRHDPCIVLRAVPVVEAVAALALADALLAAEAASPRICLTLTGKTLDEDLAQYRSQRYFTDLVELRADLLEPAERARAAAFPALVPVPVILTFRRKRDGGAFEGPEEERAAFFKGFFDCHRLPSTAVDSHRQPSIYVDFEDDFRVPGLAEAARAAGARIIRSLHDFTGPVADTPARCRAMRGATDEIPKIAFQPTSPDDVARLFAETADFTDIPHILCAMGPMGLASRALSARTHSWLTYASVGGLGDLGHVSPQELVRTYRLRTMRPGAALYGVTGWPITTTRSPELHNAAFAAADADALMVPVPSRTAEAAFRFLKATGMRGMAVTIPHKRAIMPLLDGIDPSAAAVGAVNTIVLEDGRYVGYNTDVAGFAEAFSAFAGDGLAGRRAALLGDGGAAQGVKEALRRLGVAYEVFHRRTPPQGFDFLVNATPVDPIPDYVFTGREAVYDLRYAPAETPLMARARAAGCRVENGLSMLAAQAREQRKLWKAI